jgi:hypothetical protein
VIPSGFGEILVDWTILGCSENVKVLKIWDALVDVLEIVILRVICVQIKISAI